MESDFARDMTNVSYDIVTKVTEDTEKFIFETINPYCEEITQRKIFKKDLERALTQYFSKEPCDAISREDVEAQISEWVVLREYVDEEDRFTVKKLHKRIQKLPSVQPSRKGHWIRWREDFEYIERGVTESVPHCQCSECKKEYDPHTTQFINFCPNCGAEMESEE